MRALDQKRCILGEGPIWNSIEQRLYFTNGFGNEICICDPKTGDVRVRPLPFGVAAMAFDVQNRLLISNACGVHALNADDSLSPIYDHARYRIPYANDMKVGPDGAIYVGTQSEKRQKISDRVDGKLYRISPDGRVDVLLDGLLLSNGMDWSMDETKFYHTDSDTAIIKEYDFDKRTGEIRPTGREVAVKGVDGFTVGRDDKLYVACWGQGHVAVVDTHTLAITEHIDTPTRIPASCGFCGEDMELLAITTVSWRTNTDADPLAGFTCLAKTDTSGRKPYLFGAKP